ncbi:type VI secretion system-associated FHA domain protein TagH [Litoribrevibacter euphylliae]|uniref:Type VI secretion system-associated FHA domain protein TagH n=1 Tax=Litoribrevibacter euphylliae TaxID=1834034 RepID=A0ABV7HHZ1_9GAMM
MLLELTVVSYHRLSSRQEAVKTFDQFGGTIGRSEASDWYLPDPERVVSGTHARIEKRGTSFVITDLSTNGLFVNRSVTPLGTDNSHELNDGDFLSLGEYDIEVRLIVESTIEPQVAVTPDFNDNSVAKSELGGGIPLSDFSKSEFQGAADPVSHQNAAHQSGINADSVLSMDATSVSSALDDDFLPPQPNIIPEEWASEFSNSVVSADHANGASTNRVNTNTVSATSTVMHEGITAGHNEVKETGHSFAPSTLNNNPERVGHSQGHELSAFMKGLGISEDMIPTEATDQWWEQLGGSFQQLLMGLMDTLRARSSVKSEFRVNQTTFQQKENNPLKFSANIDDAFHNLFNRKGPSFLPAEQAIKDAFEDINRHEEAIMAGAKAATFGVLNQLSPDVITAQDFRNGVFDKMTPSRKQARYWQTYVELYQDVKKDASLENKRAMNDEFTAAYEASLKGSEE